MTLVYNKNKRVVLQHNGVLMHLKRFPEIFLIKCSLLILYGGYAGI